MSAAGPKGIPGPAAGAREKRATLGTGLFTTGVWDMLTVAVPLHALAVGLNAAEIGLVVAARSVLPTALSIHGGIVMDELGVRRVLLWVAGATASLPLLYPLVCAARRAAVAPRPGVEPRHGRVPDLEPANEPR